MGKNIDDFSKIFEDIIVDFRRLEKRIFKKEGDPESFKPLSPKYAAWKHKNYPGKKIMQLRGGLKASLTGKTSDTIEVIGKRRAEFGSNLPYAHRHQMGTFGMPQRKIVQLSEKTKKRWVKIVQKWIINSMKG